MTHLSNPISWWFINSNPNLSPKSQSSFCSRSRTSSNLAYLFLFYFNIWPTWQKLYISRVFPCTFVSQKNHRYSKGDVISFRCHNILIFNRGLCKVFYLMFFAQKTSIVFSLLGYSEHTFLFGLWFFTHFCSSVHSSCQDQNSSFLN